MNTISPEGLDTVEWCDETSGNLSALVPVMKVSREEEWREWGAHALKNLRARGVVIPDPYQFRDFNEWAFRFNQVVERL